MRYILSVLVVLLSFNSLSAQEVYSSSGKPVKEKRTKEDEKGFNTSKIIFGGGFGLGIGSVTNIAVSPIVGYRISDRFAAGVGFGYQYVRIKDYWALTDPATNQGVYKPFVSTMYSPSVWARYVVWNNLFVHAEYEHNFMNFKRYYNNTLKGVIESRNEPYDAPSLLLGGGGRWPISDRVSFVLLALYDVIQDQYSPYRGTISIRFGINAGF